MLQTVEELLKVLHVTFKETTSHLLDTYFARDFFYIIPNLKQNRTNVGLNKQIQ